MVQPDVARYPLEHLRQLVVGRSLHGGVHGLPVLCPRPVGRIELVLNIEQPYASRAPYQDDGHLDQEIRLDPDGEVAARMIPAIARLVRMTAAICLRLEPGVGIRCTIRNERMGPSPNMMIGWRNNR